MDSDVWVRGDPADHCRTPCTLSIAEEASAVTLVARREGYVDRAKTIVPDHDQALGFHLQKQRGPAPATPVAAPVPAAPPPPPAPPPDEDPARL
jgi:hypothetical protein